MKAYSNKPCDTNILNWSLVFNHQPSLKENTGYCNVYYHKFPYPFGCTNNLKNAMSEYFIVANINLEHAIMKWSLDAKLKSNWHIS